MRYAKWLLWVVTGCLMVSMAGSVPATAKSSTQSVHPLQSVRVAQVNDRAEIERVVVQQLTRTGGKAQVKVEEVKVVGNFAIAHWVRGEAGGQALLEWDQQTGWGVLQSAGGAMRPENLRRFGISEDDAKQLLAR